MKRLIPSAILAVLILSGVFFAFTDSSELKFLEQIKASKQIIADQTECIDDIEASLYDFSNEISFLRSQNEVLIAENENLRSELKNQALRAAELREEMIDLELKNYELKRQLEQVLIGREIRARHQANNSSLDIADNPVELGEESVAEEKEVLEITSRISSIKAEIDKREVSLAEIAKATENTRSIIATNEAKIDFNIDLEPASDPTVSFTDPLVSQTVLFDEPQKAPRLFTEIYLDSDDDASEIAATSKDEFTSKSPVYGLLENTEVMYNYIACRNDRYGRKIKKLRKDSKNWKYTFIQFNLDTENINLLLNKEFRMRILATDLNTYVNFHTDTKKRTMSYYDFIYEGEPIKASIFNDDLKGKSFDIQIFHMVDGEEYLIEDSQKTLFTEGVNMQAKLAANIPN